MKDKKTPPAVPPIPPYTVESSPRCRNMTLFVRPDGTVSVKVPEGSDPGRINEFVIENEEWIRRTRAGMAMKDRPSTHTVAIDGRDVQVSIIYKGLRKSMSLRMSPEGGFLMYASFDARPEDVIRAIENARNTIQQVIRGEYRKKTGHQEEGGYTGQVEWNGSVIPYRVRISGRAVHVSIRVKNDRSVEVVSPQGVNPADITRIVTTKAGWIHDKVTTRDRAVGVKRTFFEGEVFPFLGGSLTVRVARDGTHVSSRRDGDAILVTLPPGTPAYAEQLAINRAVHDHYRQETEIVVPPLVERYCTRFGVQVPKVRFRHNRRRWGCCIGQRELVFSPTLCMLPVRLVEYVAAHEVCHLKVADHSPRFWDTLSTVMPDCLDRKEELKRDTPLYLLPPR